MHLLEIRGKNYLLDCGLFQGRRSEAHDRNKNFPFNPASISAVVLSHAHADHAANLPNLVRQGFRGPIYATPATRDLCNVMLFDSAYIQERDIEFVNRRRMKRGELPFKPLYSAGDVIQTMSQFVSVDYRRPFDVGEGVYASFADAGHILGSAVVRLELEEMNKKIRLGFTGDLGRRNTPILKDPEPMEPVDLLISESTYGGRIHEPIVGAKDRLLDVILKTANRHGKVIVPAFSLGRTQELLYILFELFEEHRLPPIPIYVDSPLAVNATEVFRLHPECFDEETMRYLHLHEDPFGFGKVRYVRSIEDSKRINQTREACIVISASGMCEAGRVLHHLANAVEDSRNTILVVGFQAEHTLGRKLVERQPEVNILGDVFKLKAEIAVLNALSAHAGQDELALYAAQLNNASQLKNIFLVHGELVQQQSLAEVLKSQGMQHINIPARSDTFEMNE